MKFLGTSVTKNGKEVAVTDPATTSANGLMSASDKTKLDGIPYGGTGDAGVYVSFEKEFVSEAGQTLFSWDDSMTFPVGIDVVDLFVNGDRQPRTSFTENVGGKGITLNNELDEGDNVLVSAQMSVVDLQGPQGVAGADGKTWYSSTSAPSGSLGVVGDFHLNTSTWDVNEKTAVSTWTLRGNIKGAQGLTGSTGSTGATGVGLQWVWSGTSLGIKREDQGSYTYVDLKGAAVADSVEWANVLNKPTFMDKPYHAGTTAPANTNLIWIDTN